MINGVLQGSCLGPVFFLFHVCQLLQVVDKHLLSLLLKLYRKLRKMLLSPRRESNPQPSDLRSDALIIELPGLRWQREGHDMYRITNWYILWPSLCHLSPGSSMVRASHRDQKVAGSIPVWYSKTFFWVCDKDWVTNSFPLKCLCNENDPAWHILTRWISWCCRFFNYGKKKMLYF